MKNSKIPKWKLYKKCKDCNKILGDYYSLRCKNCWGKTRRGILPKNNKYLINLWKNPIYKKSVGLKISLAKKGMKQKLQCGFQKAEKHWKWKGGITNKNHIIRNSLEYRYWRLNVLKRDNYICTICNSNKKLQADHIKPFADYPKLRFEINNGRTLCFECHYKLTWGYKKEYEESQSNYGY